MMQKILIALAVLPLGYVVLLAVLAQVSRSGAPPGLAAAALAPCPDRPNCVCSEPATRAANRVAPLRGAADADWQALKEAVRATGGEIREERPDYLAAVYRSAFFGFVDDVEARRDPAAGVIYLRSASRVGYGDRGVNRARVRQLARELGQSTDGGPENG